MQYRDFGPLDWKGSALGFGAMRLPTIDNQFDQIDEEHATRMLHYAIDHGVNYVDTAYPYHGGKSEEFLGRALQGGYRERVKLATKMPTWLIKSPDDFDRYFEEQLERLQTDLIDLYLLHSLDRKKWDNVLEHRVLDWAEKAMADGRFGYLGFSFHDSYEVFEEIVDYYDGWTFCQIQYNYMDIEEQAGRQGLHYAADKGLAVVIMEPIRGGQLTNPPPSIEEIWAEASVERTPADWALQWLWNQPQVAVVLSGMSEMQHVEENVVSADRSAVGSLSEEELALVGRVRERYRELIPIPCTQCGYCQPCPSGVKIPRILDIYNEGEMYNKMERARRTYWADWWIQEGDERADACVECGECEEACPQHIGIIEWLQRIHQEFSPPPGEE
ncbi:MAG: aldo/keto reductase [Chloroflexia bacterium]|nr:aldo/keto reductase [Chloroflexia bacterium]